MMSGRCVIDEVGIYSRALSPAEINGIYGIGAAGKRPSGPVITVQPQSQTVAGGANVALSVGAAGCPDLAYRWFHSGAEIAGATTAVLSLNNVALADAGSYQALISNNDGQATTATATLTVQQVARPAAAPIGGSYKFIRDVTLSCATPGAVIRYTLNGVEPQATDTLYEQPIVVDHDLTLKAKAWKDTWTASATLTESYFIEADSAHTPPTITLSPPSTTFLASEDIEILVEAADTDGTITLIELLRDGNQVATATSSPLRYTLPKAFAGTHTLTARAQDSDGLSAVTAPVIYTVSASGPAVSLFPQTPMFTSSPGTLVATVYGVNPGGLRSLTLNGFPLPLLTGDFNLSVALADGNNSFTLVATDTAQQSGQASTTVSLDSVPPTITITAPANNASFSTTRVNVTGTFNESSLKRITVNGILAFVSGTSWEALNVPLVEGANTLTATAEDLSWNAASATRTINGVAPLVDPVQLTADPVGGFAPLNVTLTPVAAAAIGTVQQALYDYTGDHVTLTAGSLNPTPHTYSSAGEYFPVVTVVTALGRFSSIGGWNAFGDQVRVNVQSAPVVLTTISINNPVDLKWMPGNQLYVLSGAGQSITEYDTSVTPPTIIRSVGSIGSSPTGLDVDGSGNVYVAVNGADQVKKFNPSGSSFTADDTFGTSGTIGTHGSGDGQFIQPFDVAVKPEGTAIAVTDSGNHRIQRFSSTGTFIDVFGAYGSALGEFNAPKGLVYDQLATLHIVDQGNSRVVLVSESGVVGASGTPGSALGQFSMPLNLGVSGRGIYVVDTGNNRVQAFEASTGCGVAPMPFRSRLSISSEAPLGQPLNLPQAVAPLRDLIEEKIFVADTGRNRVLLLLVPNDNPESSWNGMRQRLSAGDIAGAVQYFSSETADRYRLAFLSIPTAQLTAAISQIPAITPIFIESHFAQYRFDVIVDGVTLAFPVIFGKQDGIWKILEY